MYLIQKLKQAMMSSTGFVFIFVKRNKWLKVNTVKWQKTVAYLRLAVRYTKLMHILRLKINSTKKAIYKKVFDI